MGGWVDPNSPPKGDRVVCPTASLAPQEGALSTDQRFGFPSTSLCTSALLRSSRSKSKSVLFWDYPGVGTPCPFPVTKWQTPEVRKSCRYVGAGVGTSRWLQTTRE